MEIRLTPQQQSQLAGIARRLGGTPESVVADVVARYLDEDWRFTTAVEKSLAAADRGEFLDEEEMDARVESMLGR